MRTNQRRDASGAARNDTAWPRYRSPRSPDSIIIFYLITSLKNIYYQWFNFPGNLLPDRATVKAAVGGTVRGEGTIIFGLRAISARNSQRFPHPGMPCEPATLASSNYVC